MTLDDVHAQLDTLLADEGPVDVEALEAISRAVQTTAQPRTRAERDALVPKLEALQQRTRSELAAVGTALRDIGSSRRALRGYGHMKSTKKSQSADRRA